MKKKQEDKKKAEVAVTYGPPPKELLNARFGQQRGFSVGGSKPQMMVRSTQRSGTRGDR